MINKSYPDVGAGVDDAVALHVEELGGPIRDGTALRRPVLHRHGLPGPPHLWDGGGSIISPTSEALSGVTDPNVAVLQRERRLDLEISKPCVVYKQDMLQTHL